MENTEGLLLELDEFNRKNEDNPDISQNLENFIEHVAKTGTYIFPWSKCKKLFLQKTQNVLNNLNLSTASQKASSPSSHETYEIDQLKSRIIERFKSFNNAPFTIQRISELLLKPANNYTQQEKYLRGLEKCLMVVTTIDPSGNKILVENGSINGSLSESEEPSVSKAPATPVLNETDVSVNNVEMSTDVSESSVSITVETAVVTTNVIEGQNVTENITVAENITGTITEKITETVNEDVAEAQMEETVSEEKTIVVQTSIEVSESCVKELIEN